MEAPSQNQRPISSNHLHWQDLYQTIKIVLMPFLSSGIGYAGVAVMQYVNVYYTVILGWSLYYMFASFRSSLPWSHCNNEWNTPNCVDNLQRKNIIEQQVNNTIQNVTLFANGTVSNISASKSGDLVLASEEYWE